jgi:lipoate-protein ligase A
MPIKQRKELEDKMAKVFRENISGLSAELQKILLDDLVTAFQNRLKVLISVQEKGITKAD